DPRTELPICLDNLDAPQLKEALVEPFIELRGKLRSLRKQLDARRRMMGSAPQRPADRPVIYLDADPDDEGLWQSMKGELKDIAIVRPANLSRANGDTDPLDRDHQKRRQRQFEASDGLVLLQGGRSSWIEEAVEASYYERRLLRQRSRDLPWVILAPVGRRLSVVDDYDVPYVEAAPGTWPRDLLTKLGLSIPPAGPAP